MKKFYCLYNRNNLPFSWKLKQANEKPIANFKSREDCLNYYLSFNNVGIIWFQKANSKATRRENLKDSFDGYIKSEMKNDVLIHVIGVVPGTSENAARILKRNLFHSLQIDPETGRDLLDEKGIDRLYNNKNSYLIFDKDIAEEISTVYDAKPIKIENEEIEKKIDDTTPIDAQHSPTTQSSSPEILRDIVKNSPPNIKNQEIDEKDIVLDIEVEYNEPAKPKSDNYDFNENISGYSNNNNNNTGNENFTYPTNQTYNNFNGYNPGYQNNNFQNYGMWSRGNFGVNINDFNFKNDFGNYKFKIQPARSRYLLNNNFGNNFNNNGKILKNNFYKLYGSKGAIMNSNSNKFNTTNLGGSNDVWVPVGQPNNQNMQRPYGTIEFTAVPNQILNTELNPLGANTMIFNPYSMQNQFPNFQSNSNNSPETLIQPIIQPIIQTVYQQQNKTTVLEPIVNDPIMADGSPYNPYNDYSQYANTALLNVPKQNDTSEFRFNNNVDNTNTNSFQRNNNEGNFNSTAQQMVSAPAPVVSPAPAPIVSPTPERMNKTTTKNLNQNTSSPVVKKAVKEVGKKPKNSKKMLYSFMFISLLVMVAIIVVIILFVTRIIII